MSEKRKWMSYKIKWAYRKTLERITGKAGHYASIEGKKIMDPESANNMIYKAILLGKPFACVRYGMAEIGCAMGYDQDRLQGTDILPEKMKVLGPFDAREEVERWLTLVERDSKEIDYCAVWFCSMMEDWVYQKYAVNASFIGSRALEPYYFEKPWSAALKGKRVLVVNPFDELVRERYQKRELLFKNEMILPEFELMTLQSVWFIKKGTNPAFRDWFEAMEYMREKVHEFDFDVAILGCGPFGFHLAMEIKRMGKQAIVLGGAVQIMFGIKGKRWDAMPQVSCFYNEYWVRPNEKEAPEGAQILDKGCYW